MAAKTSKAPPPDPDRRARLVLLRDKLTADLESAAVQYVAGLARQLQSVLKELDELALPSKESGLDELTKRRADRLAVAEAPLPARGQARQRRPRSG